MHELGQIGHLATSLPWSVAEYDRLRHVMGEDFWSYGVEPNRRELEAVARYAHEQGINPREVAPEELFAPSTLSLAKV
jgi:4,5-dihydroxyphthalate decarboxylase